MATVRIDVAGFYYGRDVEVREGATVEEAMQAASNLPGLPFLNYTTEEINGRVFLDAILITHGTGTAKSRQSDDSGTPPASPRIYEPGIYSAADDAVDFTEVNGTPRLVAFDQNKTKVEAWQYYVYDKHSVDINRAFGPRKVVPFTEPFTAGAEQRGLKDGDTVVWRQVTICTRPDGGLGPKLPQSQMTNTILASR